MNLQGTTLKRTAEVTPGAQQWAACRSRLPMNLETSEQRVADPGEGFTPAKSYPPLPAGGLATAASNQRASP